MDILRCIKFESSSRHKVVFNSTMPYLVILMMTNLKFLKDSENDQINLWPECNFIALDKTMVKVWNK